MYWNQNMTFQRGLRIDTLIGCPDEALLMMAEVSVLAQWKTNAQREGILSYRELIRRGDVIEQRLRQNVTDTSSDVNLPNETTGEPDAAFPSDDVRAVVADLFKEAATLYLHTVLSGPCPGECLVQRRSNQRLNFIRCSGNRKVCSQHNANFGMFAVRDRAKCNITDHTCWMHDQ